MLGENVVELENLAQNWNKDKMLSELGAGSHMLLFWRWVTFLAVRWLRILTLPVDFRQRQVFTTVGRQTCLLPPLWHMNSKLVWQGIWFIKPNLWRGRTSLTVICFLSGASCHFTTNFRKWGRLGLLVYIFLQMIQFTKWTAWIVISS